MDQNKEMRQAELDGLRGFAALTVVLAHLTAAFRPQMYFGIENGLTENVQTWFANSPLFVLVNGSFGVYIFFVLSGFVISASADRSRSGFLKTALARCVRLSLPCAASIFFSALLMSAVLANSEGAAQIVGHWWIKKQLIVTPQPWWQVMKEAAGWYYVTGESLLNGALWTMQVELIGSLIIYAVFYSFTARMHRFMIAAGLSVAVIYFYITPFYYLCFVAGSLLYLLRNEVMKLPSMLAGIVLLTGIVLGGKSFFPPPAGTFYDGIYHGFALFHAEAYIWTLGASLLVAGVLTFQPAKIFLSNRLSRFLGRLSFSVYLLHFPLLIVLMTNLFVTWGSASSAAYIATAIIYICTVYALGFVFTFMIDEPAIRLSHRIRHGELKENSSLADAEAREDHP
ncbi:MAG: acyltransferase [Pseudomonadota bacterium]